MVEKENNNIENENNQQQTKDSIDNIESTPIISDFKYNELQTAKEEQGKKQHNKAEYLTQLIKKWDIDEIFHKFLNTNKEYIDYIINVWKPKEISEKLTFLQNKTYIEHTEKKYQKFFEETKNNEIINKLFKIIEDKNIKELINFEKDIKDLKIRLRKLQKYENWEFIDLPNWLSYELCSVKEEIEKGKTIPNWINLWEKDFFIKPHVLKNGNYKEFIYYLIEIRKLLKKKNMNIKYCKNVSRLMNIEFLENYFWNTETNIIKMFKNMEPAKIWDIIIDKKSNPIDNPEKNALRFIKKDSDLRKYININMKSFNEAEMWLDLDRLEIINSLKQKNDYIINQCKYKWKSINKILNWHNIINQIASIFNKKQIKQKKIEEIINLIHEFWNKDKNWIDHRKIDINWEVLWFSCGHKALLLDQIFSEYWNELWITEHYIAQPKWHVINIVRFDWKFHIIDSSLKPKFENINDNYEIEKKENIDIIKLKNKIKDYPFTIFPIINLWSKTNLFEAAKLEDYDLSIKEKMYKKTKTNNYEDLKSYVDILINSDEVNPLNFFTWEDYLWIAKNKSDKIYSKQIRELDYLMNDTRSLEEIQKRREILKVIKSELDVDEEYLEEIVKNNTIDNRQYPKQ